MLIKTIYLKTQEMLKELQKLYQNVTFVCISGYNENCKFLVKKC